MNSRNRRPQLIFGILTLLVFAVIGLTALTQAGSSASPAPELSEAQATVAECGPTNPFLSHPALATVERERPDWKEHVDAGFNPVVEWQRIVGCHAMMVGFSDEEPNPGYTNPRVAVHVIRWDKSDLFALVIPRNYNGKPVVIVDGGDELPRAF